MPVWEQLGMQAAGNLINEGMGLLFQPAKNQQQYEQAQRLQQMQIQGQKEMTDYNMAKQLDMWNKTNYKAQMEHMKAAGLNPGLIYGMSGGGGTTTGTASGSVSGQSAGIAVASHGAESMGIQMQLVEAQKKVLETQAEKNQAEAAKISGTDTQESQTRIDALLQGIDNARQQHEIQKLDITLKNIENFEKQASQEDRLDYITYQTRIAMKQFENVKAEAFINTKTVQEKINIIRQESIGAIIKNELLKSGIEINQAQIKKWTQEIMQGWDKMDQENRKIMLQKIQTDWNTDATREGTSHIIDVIEDIFRATK